MGRITGNRDNSDYFENGKTQCDDEHGATSYRTPRSQFRCWVHLGEVQHLYPFQLPAEELCNWWGARPDVAVGAGTLESTAT